jgi:flagellar assembly factor FliW
MAPIVINAKTRRAVQVIQASSRYSHRHPLGQRHPEPVTEAVAV